MTNPSYSQTTDKTQTTRQQALQEWLQQVFDKASFRIESLAGDASFRRYHRVYVLVADDPFDTQKDDLRDDEIKDIENLENCYMVMDAPPEKESITEFVAVAELFSNHVNVPDILAKDMVQGFLLLQDFGHIEFAHLIASGDTAVIDDYYQRAMHAILLLQTIDVDMAREMAGLPDYDRAMLLREMDLFKEWFLPYIGVAFDDDAQACWQGFTDNVISAVLNQPQVVVHRDYHSRNIMQDYKDPSYPGIIDFQDAVIGSYTYDLVSLLRDAYVNWSEEQVSLWFEQYWEMLKTMKDITACELACINVSKEQLYYDMNMMGIQRHLKVLGIFIRLSERDGKNRYLADIPKVMQDLLFELDWLAQYLNGQVNTADSANDNIAISDKSTSDMQQAVNGFIQWFEQSILPAYQQSFVHKV